MEQEQSILTSVHVYSIADEDKGRSTQKVLVRDGRVCYCHKLPPFGVPSTIAGQMELKRVPCGTDCPRAEIKNNESGRFVYVTNCEIHETSFLLATEEEVKKSGITTKNTGALISIK